MSRVIGVDVGGTFTDVVMLDGESIVGHKVRTTPDQSDGVARALSDAGIDEGTTMLHGTTAGTNALIEGRGARTALVTTPDSRTCSRSAVRPVLPYMTRSWTDRMPSAAGSSIRLYGRHRGARRNAR